MMTLGITSYRIALDADGISHHGILSLIGALLLQQAQDEKLWFIVTSKGLIPRLLMDGSSN
jgi:hypothetical protein